MDRRHRPSARLDTPDAQSPPVRQSITEGVLALDRLADAIAADTASAAGE